MRKTFVIVTLIILTTVLFSALTATTDDGRRVVLNNNGTWEWLNNPQPTPTPYPSPRLLYDITGHWNISWTVGIFDENVDVQIYLQNGSYMMLWKGTFSEEKYPITVLNEREIRFQGKSFHNGILSFDATIKDSANMQGVASSSGTFAKTGSFKGVRK